MVSMIWVDLEPKLCIQKIALLWNQYNQSKNEYLNSLIKTLTFILALFKQYSHLIHQFKFKMFLFNLFSITEAVTTFNGHTSGIKHVMFFQNDRRIISCADDKTVRIWDPLSGQVCSKLKSFIVFINTILRIYYLL